MRRRSKLEPADSQGDSAWRGGKFGIRVTSIASKCLSIAVFRDFAKVQIEVELQSLEFKSLRLIIDYILGNENSLDEKLYPFLPIVSANLSKHAALLETKIPPVPKFNYPEFQRWDQSEILGTNDPALLSLTKQVFENLEKQRSDNDRWQRMRYETLFSEIISKINQQWSIVARIRKEVELYKKSRQEKTEKVPWKILPPGEHPFQQILAYFEEVRRRRPEIRVDEDRLSKVESLNPDQRFTGEDEFDGYIVFYFDRTEMAVLESPMFGNAIYIIRGKWRSLSRKSKGELLARHSRTVKRLIHRGDWFARLSKLIEVEPAGKALPRKPSAKNVQTVIVPAKKEVVPNQLAINLIYTPRHALKAQQVREMLVSLGLAVRPLPVEEDRSVFSHKGRLYYFSDSRECSRVADRIAKAISDVEKLHPQFIHPPSAKKDMENLTQSGWFEEF